MPDYAIVLLVVQCVSHLYMPRKLCSVLLAMRLLMQGQASAVYGDLESDQVIGRYVHRNICWILFSAWQGEWTYT
jgi:hypothetical protein